MCYDSLVQKENSIAKEVVDAALKLHRHFGPGIYESRLGLLINFGENLLKDGIHRIVNDL